MVEQIVLGKCKDKPDIDCVYFINPNDIKEITEEKGIVLKRRYGKFKREIKRIDL